MFAGAFTSPTGVGMLTMAAGVAQMVGSAAECEKSWFS
jgi:hypothetical protein